MTDNQILDLLYWLVRVTAVAYAVWVAVVAYRLVDEYLESRPYKRRTQGR